MVKEIKEERKSTKEKEESSIDWFEDHESHEEDEDSKEDPSDIEIEDDDIFFDDETFSRRMTNFLVNQRKDVSLENMLDSPEVNLEDRLPKQEDRNPNPDKVFDYMTIDPTNELKYENVGWSFFQAVGKADGGIQQFAVHRQTIDL